MGFNIKKFIQATVSHLTISFAVAYIWTMIMFQDLYIAVGAQTRSEPIIVLGLIAMLLQAVVIAYIYPLFYRPGLHPVAQGIKFNLLMGAMAFSIFGFVTAAKYDINPIAPFLFYTLMFQVFQFVFTGVALGLIYGRIDENS